LVQIMKIKLVILTVFMLAIFISSISAISPSTSDAYVYIISPTNGEHVTSPVLVKFGLHGMGIAPAGTEIKGTGHHHLLIDVKNLPDLDKILPANDSHIHFGKGQTETLIELAPGKHTLQLLFADFVHISHDPLVISEPITIHVVE